MVLGQPKHELKFPFRKRTASFGSTFNDRNHCSEVRVGKSSSQKIPISNQNPHWDRWLYRIGCPVWGCRQWANDVYPEGTSTDDLLAWYSRAFPTVEGNSTFYGVPSKSTFEKWRDTSAETFQFCLKFPRKISHELRLVNCEAELADWLDKLFVLQQANRLGPTFLQLAPSFSFAYFTQLDAFLRKLPQNWPWAIEVRHLDWFDGGDKEECLNGLLRELEIDRVLFDSRPLNSLSATDATEENSQSRKPKSPFRTTVTGRRPMVRLIGRNDAAEVIVYWEWWSNQIATWIKQGYQPFILTHAPDDAFAPGLARILHELIRLHLPELPALPTLQARDNVVHEPTKEWKQMKLF